MGHEEFETLLRFFKVMGNESRLKILGILANQEGSVEELATLLGLREPTISHHLARLKELGLVKMRAEGNTHLYWLDVEALQALNRAILTPEKMVAMIGPVETGAWEQKVLLNFLDGDRLKEIPASHKKRLVILKWLATQFEAGVDYPEAQVNEIIKRHHPDSATLRRELIGSRLMERANGIYRRTPAAGS